MDGEQWELFQNDLNKYISNSEILKFNFNDKNNINHIWDKIKKGLVQASKNCIPIEKIKLTKSQVNPMKISNAYKKKKIKLAIDQRCEDLLENQKRMINSVMEREIKSIVLDRVLIKENNEDKLITDEEKIKDIVNDHFQNIAGSTNQPKILSEYWAKFYFPQDEINDKIYKDLMVEPTNDELNEALNKLSNNKASGPTAMGLSTS
ncbi:uncharacterized protein OCT59_003003 [Rhizophagus irregularis]|uniref:uncharacterized protein n=1 Tax=Rhizophagus irregularis TaxID=588596 RepID=UPI00332AA16C|nr:hypothetical protein OCT59_003003 [Rhizophagus irregularis]